jgi:hypothetical protein
MSSEPAPVALPDFDALIEDAGGGGAFVRVPFDVESVFGRKRVRVITLVDGISCRCSIVRMGLPCHLLPVPREIRRKLGKGPGSTVRISLSEDTEPRTVSVPGDLRAALDAVPGASGRFDGSSYTARRQAVAAIESVKRPETRSRLIAKVVSELGARPLPDPGSTGAGSPQGRNS